MTAAGTVLDPASALYATLDELAREARLAFFAGLPGSGKSLLVHQLVRLAHAAGRGPITLLQWDVARPVFEACAAGRRYPQQDGVTHGIIRLAVGRWARAAVTQWAAAHRDARALLVGETPLVGHRLVELARPARDEAEGLLSAPWTRFVVPVPSRDVRGHLEAERERRLRAPLHEREREDAPPQVLRDLWHQLVGVARQIGLAPPGDARIPYDPRLYGRVYATVLRHRHCQILAVDTVMPTRSLSPYAHAIPVRDLVPDEAAAADAVRATEAAYPEPRMVAALIEGWFAADPTAAAQTHEAPGPLLGSGRS